MLDVTRLKESEVALRVQDRRKDEFLALLAHELRNPLAPLVTGLEVMAMAADDPATLERTRRTMERQAHQLVTLVDDLLDVSRITRGKLELRQTRMALSDAVQSAVEATRPAMVDGDHTLSAHLPDRPVFLDADPTRVAQVLSNLLSNAAKYTRRGGRITLEAARNEEEVAITIRDNGIGIPAELMDDIFEMFTQLDRPMERGKMGLGVGLSLTKTLVEMHGGRIKASSAGIDQGSTFTVSLPVLPEDIVSTDPKGAKDAPTSSHGATKVLVVDDNEAAMEILEMVVNLLGNEVRTASDGVMAIEVAKEFRPDLVLMDLGMPGMSGFEAAKHIRAQSWGKAMKLVALSGWGQPEHKIRTREAGFDLHMVKPPKLEDLKRLLAEGGNGSG
jgi:CheY-like chemotaxis protein